MAKEHLKCEFLVFWKNRLIENLSRECVPADTIFIDEIRPDGRGPRLGIGSDMKAVVNCHGGHLTCQPQANNFQRDHLTLAQYDPSRR